MTCKFNGRRKQCRLLIVITDVAGRHRCRYQYGASDHALNVIDGVWYRDMLPTLEPVGLEWATFQVLRRTNASLSRKAKIDDKVSADQRGHGLGVSLEVYSISGVQQKIDVAKRASNPR